MQLDTSLFMKPCLSITDYSHGPSKSEAYYFNVRKTKEKAGVNLNLDLSFIGLGWTGVFLKDFSSCCLGFC